ncbi:class I SAM-dependent methyltransferase [Candidatus Gottesmanbacteria bacterium]|nr:class I SAM-dependent methyltransferase [Candidatus Gottesmanbacteria bacterium]
MKLLNRLIRKISRTRSKIVIDRINSFIEKSSKIIDIGSGTGDIAYLLKERGKDITPVDVADFHGVRLINTTIYDGQRLPFSDNSFDTALLLMVMHHTPSPDLVFSEAARVAKEIIVIETSYTNRIDRWFTVITDAMGNLRLQAFWSSYKTDEDWRRFFSQKGFKIIQSQKYHDRNFGFPFLHISYYLKKI